MKIAPLHRAFQQTGKIDSKIVHTGQHYDAAMNELFFQQLSLPKPDYYLGIGSKSHSQQTAAIMTAFEPILLDEKPDLVLVVGDVNSTLACSLVAVKEHVEVAHVEAGLRSFDRSMPEEINRIVTDSIANYLFVTEEAGITNLKNEGVADEKVFMVGNTMIDSLIFYLEKAESRPTLKETGVNAGEFALMTMHRPSNVDNIDGLRKILSIIEQTASRMPLVFPVHPRTKASLEKHDLFGQLEATSNLILTPPLGYLDFLALLAKAKLVITDSGGIQEETTYLGAPCLTFRDSTERPSTVELGTNVLLANLDPTNTIKEVDKILDGKGKKGEIPPLWDGKTGERIAEHFANK